MTDKKIPSPEEIQKEFEDFVKDRFGGNVQVLSHPITQQEKPVDQESSEAFEPGEVDPMELVKNFNYRPKDIKAYLDRYVIKQDEAKKAIAIAVCDHYNHVRMSLENKDADIENYSKQNVLILGATGVGKTYLIKHIAKLIGVPFVKADATRFTETGYVGANVEDLVRDLVSQANGDIKLAQYGIVYLDEADKLAAATGMQRGGKDISGRGVQTSLLKLMEETEIDLTAGNDMRAQMQAFMEFQQKGKMSTKKVNTKHILFIVSGAFTGIDDIIKERLNQKDIGFSASQDRVLENEDLLMHASTEDFVEYGFEPEFVGRLPIRVACQNLKQEDLYHILKNSEGSIVRQYELAFKAYGIKASFSDEALNKIAEYAFAQKTGARALMTVCEKALRDYKFELPSTGIHSLSITEKVIESPRTELDRLLSDPKYKKHLAHLQGITAFEEHFYNAFDMDIEFTDEAGESICKKSDETGKDSFTICAELLASYEHGLKLIQQNTNQQKFTLDVDVVSNPKGTLEKMIRESYS